MPLTRAELERAPWAYFEAVDRKDIHASLAFFADDATFTVQSAQLVFSGKDEITGMFRTFFGDYATVSHGITNIVVDVDAQKVSTEQSCPHVKNDGTPDHVTTCNFFTFAPDGRFARVIIWIDQASPLRRSD